MPFLLSNITEILILLFILITLLSSGIEKVSDWTAQVAWLRTHFSKHFLGKMIPFLLGVLVVLDFLASALSIWGIFMLIFYDETSIGLYACICASLVLLCLLFGQRVAKDYQGAFTIVGYFMVVIFGVWLLSNGA